MCAGKQYSIEGTLFLQVARMVRVQVYRGWNKQPYNCSKQSVCFTSLYKQGHLVHFPMALIQSISVIHIDPSQNNRPCVHSGSLIWRSHAAVPYMSGFIFCFAVFFVDGILRGKYFGGHIKCPLTPNCLQVS